MFLVVVVKVLPELGGAFIIICFPSRAPKQFGNLHLILNPSSTLFHLALSGIGITSSDNAFQIAKQVSFTILCIVDIPTLKRALNVK